VATVSLPEPVGEVVLRAGAHVLRHGVAADAGDQARVDIELPEAHSLVELSLSHPGYVHFVGYEAGARS
jgi:hypothetical protein